MGAAPPENRAPAPLLDAREIHLAEAVQLTDGGENAEAYWSPDGRQLVFQSTRPPFACDQIFRMSGDGRGEPVRVSTGKGRTTCAYFTSDGGRILYSSTHQAGDACPAPPDRSQGYVWPVDPDFEIWSALPDGSDLRRLTENKAYDAESTVCPVDGSVIFTSTRDGDLELYRMTGDGKAITRLTNTPGYDGGAFFSNDCKKIVWRASRPAAGTELEDYRRLLAQGLVRPSKLEIWVAGADGSGARQVTSLGAASFAPSFFPSGDSILFSTNYGDPKGREFEIWAVNVDGSGLERITWSEGFDGFPLFSPDGTHLAFSSNRNQGAPGETNVFVANWVEGPKSAAVERYLKDVRWLADDAREGRGIGTRGLEEASRYLERRFRETGIEPAGQDGTFFHRFDAPVAVESKAGTAMTLDGEPVARAEYEPASFSASSKVEGEVVAAGYGITAPDLGVDDYKGIDARGKIVAVRRFTPSGGPFEKEDAERRYGDLRYKTFNAREHGAIGMIVVDAPLVKEGEEAPSEAPLPALRLDSGLTAAAGDAGIPVVTLSRAAGSALFEGAHRISLTVELEHRHETLANVVGVIRAGAPARLPGAILVGAHYDHIGLGGASSLSPDAREPHNGADDNASGTAALLEVGRLLAGRRDHLRRDVYLIAFSGEEMGVLGSTALTRKPPAGLEMKDLMAMFNMDMVGRLRGNALSVLGAESAKEWHEIVDPVCERAGLACSLGGDGYGPSDQYPFYAAGIPVLHFFTGVHEDYHKPTDDSGKVNGDGGVRVAALVAELTEGLSVRPERLAYKSLPAPAPPGDTRSMGASLGTVPDYTGDGRPGVLLSGVRAGSAAEQAGMQRGDLLVELGGTPIRDIHDFMYVLRRAKPGEKAAAVVLRGEERVTVEVTYGVSRGMR
ncbi:MAG TPA: M28 family peptidase [Thermoanaerobaculia bacterium]|jgi:Tol biopolymer transport system component|nr:M28 family peptidase [Thermoanaerobaculia bacterium]